MEKEIVKLGIDLGTTNTLACYIEKGKPKLLKFPGGTILPSVVYMEEDGRLLVGNTAYKRYPSDPVNGIRSSKTDMGDFNKKYTIRGKQFTPTDIAALILGEVKKTILKKMKKSEEEMTVEALITVPAYFDMNQKDETKRAGERAGLKVLGIITEPSAAAIANIKAAGIDKEKIFVVDLGGGTFDVSILEAVGNGYEPLAVGGNKHLGGDDFDKCIITKIKKFIEDDITIDLTSLETSKLSYKDYYLMVGQIEKEAREAKEALSEDMTYNVDIPNLFSYNNEPYNLERTISRTDFYSWAAPLFEQIKSVIYQVFTDRPEIRLADIDRVILAGGSCYIPKIKEDVESIFHKSTEAEIPRETMVVTGAAFVASSADGVSPDMIKDIISHSLGIRVLNKDNSVDEFEAILARGKVYPYKNTKTFTTTMDYQETVAIEIYEAGDQKENIKELFAHDGTPYHQLYGSFELNGIQKAKKGIPQIEVTFSYDGGNQLVVTAEDMLTHSKKTVQIEKGKKIETKNRVQPVSFELLIDISGSMKGKKIQEAKAAASKLVAEILDLKTHAIGIATFGDNAEGISRLSQNRQELLNKIARIDAGNNWTNMQAGIAYGSRVLSDNSKKKVLLIVTDGSPCTGGNDSRDETDTIQAADKAHAEGIDIITIAVGRSANSAFLHRIATSGMDYTIDSMDKLAETFETAVKQYLQVK